ncbi:MAG: hypothetical protein KGQ93_01475 [Cyanobacteria bacterium REEB459]|nr:hypothetical protein [Cyanobacteria bacterium REEB459]
MPPDEGQTGTVQGWPSGDRAEAAIKPAAQQEMATNEPQLAQRRVRQGHPLQTLLQRQIPQLVINTDRVA